MKAIVLKDFGSTDNFVLAEVATPNITDNEVLVKIMASSFNPIDYQMRQGATESKLLKSPILGRELSGVVVERGKNANEFSVGDNVSAYVGSLASNGTYAEFISIPKQLLAKNPKALSFAQAAALPMVGMTALQCFNRLAIPKNQTIFIAGGAGGVGTILIKLLLATGNTHIITTAGNEESKNQLLKLGLSADAIINYKQTDFKEQLLSKTSSGKFDYCIDLVGGNMSEVCAELLQIHGTYADITFLATDKARELLFDKAATIVNVANYAYTLSGNEEDIAFYGKALAELFDKIDQQLLSPTDITVVGNLNVETVAKAHLLMENNQTKGKKLVMVAE